MTVNLFSARMNDGYFAPAVVVLHAVNGQRDHLHVALGEFPAEFGGAGELGGAHWGVVPGVREEDAPPGEKGTSHMDTKPIKSGYQWTSITFL